MKASITKEAFIEIKAETIEEVYALKYIVEKHRNSSSEDEIYIIDCSIIDRNELEK
jgi:hypothetical protein